MAGKRQSEELDLTPFIGLFAMLVVLLLVTASWSKLYSFKTKFSKAVESIAPPPGEEKKKELSLKILAFKDRIFFIVQKGEKKRTKQLTFRSDNLPLEKIKSQILRWSQFYGEDKQITLESVPDFQYGTLIEIYDTIFGVGMKTIAISTKNLSESEMEMELGG